MVSLLAVFQDVIPQSIRPFLHFRNQLARLVHDQYLTWNLFCRLTKRLQIPGTSVLGPAVLRIMESGAHHESEQKHQYSQMIDHASKFRLYACRYCSG